MASRKWPGANRGLLLVAFLLLGTIPLFPQVAIEVDAGLNLFDIVPNAFTLDVSIPTFGSGQLVQGITTPNMFAFGVTAGIHATLHLQADGGMDPRLRGDDASKGPIR